MEYTVQKLAALAGVTTRALRYYDEIGLLPPKRVSSSGYRIYGVEQVDRLQQIMFYRELEVPLEEIGRILDTPGFHHMSALLEHRERLLEKRERINALIANVEQSISAGQGGIRMSDKEKFMGFQRKRLEENEERFGEEIREKYGNNRVEASNRKFLEMTQEEHERGEELQAEIHRLLQRAWETGDPAGEDAVRLAKTHKEWLCLYWTEYSREAHAGLAQMYVQDERFARYYDEERCGKVEFLRDAIAHFTNSAAGEPKN